MLAFCKVGITILVLTRFGGLDTLFIDFGFIAANRLGSPSVGTARAFQQSRKSDYSLCLAVHPYASKPCEFMLRPLRPPPLLIDDQQRGERRVKGTAAV